MKCYVKSCNHSGKLFISDSVMGVRMASHESPVGNYASVADALEAHPDAKDLTGSAWSMHKLGRFQGEGEWPYGCNGEFLKKEEVQNGKTGGNGDSA